MSRPPRNNYLLVVFDSCRYDTFVGARPKNIRRLGPIERRWSYASWTAPTHFNLLTGLMPHVSPKRVYASGLLRTFRANGAAVVPTTWSPHPNEYAPDLVVGYAPGYLVPGVLISNRRSKIANPDLKDLPASILAMFEQKL